MYVYHHRLSHKRNNEYLCMNWFSSLFFSFGHFRVLRPKTLRTKCILVATWNKMHKNMRFTYKYDWETLVNPRKQVVLIMVMNGTYTIYLRFKNVLLCKKNLQLVHFCNFTLYVQKNRLILRSLKMHMLFIKCLYVWKMILLYTTSLLKYI